jgi:hypothetical protein
MGLNRDMINTVDDERVVSNFMTVEDTAFALWLAWWQERQSFGRITTTVRPPEPFLGTQLVLVSRTLSVVAEAVQELYFSLDSVFVGPPERQTIRLKLPSGTLYLSELLEWVDDLASTTWPRYIQDSGKDGVIAMTQTLKAVKLAVHETTGLPLLSPAMGSPRVKFALRKLDDQLAELVDLTDKFARTAVAEAHFETAPTPVRQPGRNKR